MSNVVDLATARIERGPHLMGTTRCLHCKHEQVCVAPVSVEGSLECGSCGLMRAVWVYPFEFDDGEKRFTCNKCDSSYFQIGVSRVICIGCGTTTSFEQLAEVAP